MNPFFISQLSMQELHILGTASSKTVLFMTPFYLLLLFVTTAPIGFTPTVLYFSFVGFLLITQFRCLRRMRKILAYAKAEYEAMCALKNIADILKEAERRHKAEKKEDEE